MVHTKKTGRLQTVLLHRLGLSSLQGWGAVNLPAPTYSCLSTYAVKLGQVIANRDARIHGLFEVIVGLFVSSFEMESHSEYSGRNFAVASAIEDGVTTFRGLTVLGAVTSLGVSDQGYWTRTLGSASCHRSRRLLAKTTL